MKTVVLYSGGLDSTALLLAPPISVEVVGAISVDYGQRHRRELDSARRIAAIAKVPHRVVDLKSLASVFGDSALTSDTPVPHGHYEAESMKATVVPNRNMILISIAAAYAETLGAEAVAYAAHSGDHAIYPDCREDFFKATAFALSLASEDGLILFAPFITQSKAWVVHHAASRSKVAHDALALSWSCYEGGEVHCGKCGTCVERREAFIEAGVEDRTGYLAEL